MLDPHDLITEIKDLASRIDPIDGQSARQLQNLADILQKPENTTIDLYGAFDLGAIEEKTFSDYQIRPRWFRRWLGFIEWGRNIMVLIPIALTWYGLWQASVNYEALISLHPENIVRPFLLLWEEGFKGLDSASGPTFSQVAFLDFGLLAGVLILTFVVHFYKDAREAAAAKKALELRCRLEEVLWHANVFLAEARHNQTQIATVSQFQDAAGELVKQLQDDRKRMMQYDDLGQQLSVVVDKLDTYLQNMQMMNNPLDQSIQILAGNVSQIGQQQSTLVTTLQALDNQMGNLVNDIHTATDELGRSVDRISNYTGLSTGTFQQIGELLDDMTDRTDRLMDKLEQATQRIGASFQLMDDIVNSMRELDRDLTPSLRFFSAQINEFSNHVPGIFADLQKSGQSMRIAAGRLTDSASKIITSAQVSQNSQTALDQLTKKLTYITNSLQTATSNAEAFSTNMNVVMIELSRSGKDLAPVLRGLTELIQAGGQLRWGSFERSVMAIVSITLTGTFIALAVLAVEALGWIG